jgi:hypothetical protein
LKAKIYADGRQQVWLYNTPKPGYAHENRQFYTQTADTIDDPSVGWILHLYDQNNQKWSVGRGDVTFLSQLSQNSIAPNNNIIYNGVTASPDGRSATVSMTVKYKGSLSNTLDILLTYHIDQGSRQMPVRVKIINNTSTNFSKMNFIFSEDSYFGESLYATGNYNALANMVYVWKNNKYGIMSITGSAATPFNNWDATAWDKIRPELRLANDALKNPTQRTPGNTDAILAAGWRYNNFSSGKTINISYYESWTAPSDFQIIPPAGKTVPPEARVNYEFYIINLTNAAVNTRKLELKSSHGWTAKLTGGSQNIIIPPGETATVTAELTVPPEGELGVADGVKDNLTLTATPQSGNSASGSTTTTINDDMPALNITKVNQTNKDVTFRVDFLNITGEHNTTVRILDMDGNVLSTPAAQARKIKSGETFTFPLAGLTLGNQYMAEADARPDIIYPARTTFTPVKISMYHFAFNKVDVSGKTPLKGAEFNLFVCNEGHMDRTKHSDYDPTKVGTVGYCWEPVNDPDNPIVSGSDGLVDFGEILSGTYLLREVKAPSGYERPLGWWIIDVDAKDENNPVKSITGAGPSLPPAFISDTGYKNLRLPNYEKTVLPLTGSIPTDLTIAAAILVLGIAALIFITSRKRKGATIKKNILRFALADLLVVVVLFTTFSMVATGVYAADPTVGSITVHKYEAYSSSGAGSGTSADVSKLPEESKPLSGIKFTVKKVKVDHTPATIDDVVFTNEGINYVADNSGVYTPKTVATNGAGQAVFSGLPLGLYLVSEQSPAIPFLVAIPTVVAGASETALYDIHVYPKTLVSPSINSPMKPNNPVGVGKPIVNPDAQAVKDNETSSEPQPPENGSHDVDNNEVPFGEYNTSNAWSLLSLIMSLIAIIISIILIIYWIFRRRNEDDKYEKEKRNAFIARTLTIIFGILTPIVFLILDDMRLPVVWINKWTLYVGIAFFIHILSFVIYKFRDGKEDADEPMQEPLAESDVK